MVLKSGFSLYVDLVGFFFVGLSSLLLFISSVPTQKWGVFSLCWQDIMLSRWLQLLTSDAGSILNAGISWAKLMKNGMIECSVCHSKLVPPTTKTVSRAYDRHRSKLSSKHRALNVILVVGDCILVGLQVIVLSFLPNP